MRRIAPVLLAAAVVAAGCSSSDRQAAAPVEWPACGAAPAEVKVCLADGTVSPIYVFNGGSAAFAGADGLPAASISLVETCWAPPDGVDPTECTSDGKQAPAGLASITTIGGYPAVTFDAGFVPDPTGEAVEGLPPLPALVDVRSASGTIRIEVPCCTDLP